MTAVRQATIPCVISRGMFQDERAVIVALPNEAKATFLVDKRHVIPQDDPGPGRQVEGYVKVSIVAEQDDSVIVDLPQPGLTVGPRIAVRGDEIKFRDLIA
ncbi:MAG: hypothetical protein HY691_07045 [Chloroflexi bacterium]|nr:hypothetical protein [Chloroflexota bacterium]